MQVIEFWKKSCAPYLRAKARKANEVGASLVEYALLVALIAVVCIGAVSIIGGQAKDKFTDVGDCLESSADCDDGAAAG